MHGDDGGLDYLEIIAKTLGGDVDNEDGIFSYEDEEDDDKESDEDDGCRNKKKALAKKAHPSRQYKDVMTRSCDTNKHEACDLAAKVRSCLEAMPDVRPSLPPTQQNGDDAMIMKRIELEMARDDTMDARFSAMLTNPNCPTALVESMTAHFMKQIQAREC